MPRLPDSLRDRLLGVHMGWRHVLFANWAVDPAVVAPHVPDALALDTHDGDAYLSVVPFTNSYVRPRALPAGLEFELPELNLRTYVTHGDAAGVYFFTLDADGLLGVTGARLFHHLPYHLASIEMTVGNGSSADVEPSRVDDAPRPRIRFASRRRHPGARPCAFDATYGPTDEPVESEPGGLRWFLTERYRYFTETPGGELRSAAVRHDPWEFAAATVDVRENRCLAACGFDEPEGEPTVFYSPGVDVVATASRRVE